MSSPIVLPNFDTGYGAPQVSSGGGSSNTGGIVAAIINAGSGITQSIINSKALANAYKYAPNSFAVPNLSINPQTGALQASGNNSMVIIFGLVAVVVLVLFLRK